ncbi:hypothetical protein ABM187_001291 [Stenotrophomonas maltophilia]|uniref:Transposase n=2 Tax=Lysobacteraceae TaxID=32033 RepID=A0A2J0SND7_STEMA|nr:hypothetical protein [Stenotrophomonas maltophilia]MBH1412132.1 hypothetical protein [Stenotrophomonas maltophilia]MBH1744656.1 hypothetical protein [Stenotrophomonas maltophilia]MBH1863827.1 hypothetical protein [Stenotrophomonas maltophilia]PJK98429.1 hypothetical protein B9Y57_12170 [Stenotrophomonas maltophilia]
MAESRRISMLELDRHLSQSLEQARHAPLNVQRYGRSWVWVLSSDAWADAARWAALDSSAHPLLALRRALDLQLRPWPEAAMGALPLDAGDARLLQRAALLVVVRDLSGAQRVYDDLRYHQAYRMFIGLDHGTAWSPMQCVRLLQACVHPLLRACIDETLASVPPQLIEAARVRAARASPLAPAQRIAGGCLSY